jgi:hypothetical protein
VCQLLRGISSVTRILELLARPDIQLNASIQDHQVSVLQIGLDQCARTYGAQLLGMLEMVKVEASPDRVTHRPTPLKDHATFRFASDSDEIPETWDDWLFLWSSVIVATMSAMREGVITEHQFGTICTHKDINAIWAVLRSPNTCNDHRFRLHALWALDHLLPDRYGVHPAKASTAQIAEEAGIPSDFVPHEKEVKWLKDQVRKSVTYLLRSDIGLVDVHVPYQVFAEQGNNREFRDDYYVVPVLPVLIDQVARHKDWWLFRPRLTRLLARWPPSITSAATGGNVSLLPFQVGSDVPPII